MTNSNRPAYTHVEVEANPNCPMSANQVFKNLGEPVAISHVRIFEGEPDGKLCGITGWSSAGDGSPVPAYAVAVEDSGSGNALLVYGGDWGVRLRDSETDGWSMEASGQWGETHLVIADMEDVVTI